MQLSRDTFVYILQVYLPCSNHRIEQFREHIEQLFNLISMLSQLGSVIAIGDFNAHLNGSRYIRQIDKRGQDLYDLMSQVGMFNVTTSSLCEGTSTSYVSYNKRLESLIDHAFITADLVQSIFSCRILDDDCLNVSCHRPICIKLRLSAFQHPGHVEHMNKPVKWRKVSEAQKYDFQVSLCDSLKSKADAIPTESISNFIDKLYHCIVMCINDASDAELPHSCYRPYLKPYWSTDLRK